MNPLALVGRSFLGMLDSIGDLTLFAGRAIFQGISGPYYPRAIFRQMIDIGYYSLPVVGLTAIFTGMVLALQSHTGFSRFEAESAVATIVVLSMTRELGPVLAGLMVCRACRRFHGRRTRNDARYRADRRADHPFHQPLQISGLAEDPGRLLDAAAFGAGRRCYRRSRRLPGGRLQARLWTDRVSEPHLRPTSKRRTSFQAW